MNKDLFEHLLNESESTSLDFKSEQYEFYSTDDKAKSELLKDILAFANSFRRTDAYILIGVKEVKGGQSIATGIEKHLEDSDIQQFVNSKTQKPLSFLYIPYLYESKQVGIIYIPSQQRPYFLKQDFGNLR
jgi:predicted HTH transcriptional regulator